jgi:FKBP-type peptidyl-prolyl cis-trans isomerase
MRRFLGLIVIPALASLVLAGCGGTPNAMPGTTPTVNANSKVTVTGAFGAPPVVSIPKLAASNELTVKTVIQGTGPVLTKKDSLVANFMLYFWTGTSSSLKANTFVTNPSIVGGQMIPGLESALIGQKVGSRVLAIIPPAQGYGTGGDSQLGVSPNTYLVFVIDVIKSYSATASASGSVVSTGGNGLPTVAATAAGTAPVATIPSGTPPTKLEVKTLIKGSGPVLAKGQYVIAQYVGYIWRTKKTFGSSWASGSPFGFIFQDATPQVISGWDTGLAGQTIGSRVLLVIPPKDGYGSSGASQAGIKGTDVLVYVVDILDAFQNSTSGAAASSSPTAAAVASPSASASSTG